MDDIQRPPARDSNKTRVIALGQGAITYHGTRNRQPIGQPPAPTSARRTIRIRIPHIGHPNFTLPTTFGQWLQSCQVIGTRLALAIIILVVIGAEVIVNLAPYIQPQSYQLGRADNLLDPINATMASKLSLDATTGSFTFNADPESTPGADLSATNEAMSASLSQDASKGITVTDPQSTISFTMTPAFNLLTGRQDGNRVVYPLDGANGWLVYSLHAIGVKEDLVLTSAPTNETIYRYTLGLGDTLAAHIEPDGTLGIYGNTLLSGNVSTGSAKDAALLQKARQQAPKTTLLFTIPRPVIHSLNPKATLPSAHYSLAGDELSVTVTGLSRASYPLTIDPSIYVTTAQQFMAGNNETNINFDVADALIEKSPTTGARFNSWTATQALPISVWDQGTAVAGGYVYSVGGMTSNGQIFTTPGTSNYIVPTGVTSVIVKAWGAGGGGGAGSGGSGSGGAGGGGGYTSATITVTPGETLAVDVGSGGTDAQANNNGGNGGGYSALRRSSTFLIQAGGGGGGGGTRGNATGGAGGAGGGSSGVTGSNASSGAHGGTQGTTSAGGTGGSAGTNGVAGANGAANAGGNGGGSATNCTTSVAGSTGGAGGTGGGGKGGTAGTCEGGGGGGGGRFGGGGGGSVNSNNNGGGGGGGGSDLVTGTGTTETAGSGTTPGNSSDSVRNGAGNGGSGGTTTTGSNGGSNGLVFITYGSGSTINSSVNWAQFDTTTGAIDSPNPGTGTCSGWCTTAAYNLPSGRAGFSMVAYNGFLYVLGGVSDTSGTLTNTVYIAKLGANGEPQLWHPTDPNKNNWVYWYTSANTLPDNIAYGAAVAYNNHLYILGGKTTTHSTGDSLVRVANLNPTGDIGAWSSTGMTQLSSGATSRFGLAAETYNGFIYILGGDNSGTLLNDVYYVKLNSDGTMANSSWIQTASFATPRMSWGGDMTTIWGAYIYLAGGCSALTSGFCSTVASDTQLASINTDGSLDTWNTNASVTNQRMGFGLEAWRGISSQSGGTIYEFGGCTAQNTTDGTCVVGGIDNSLSDVEFGNINQDGDASTVSQSAASGTAPCSGGSPTGCNLPGTANVGDMLSGTVIANGYLYVIGGCTNNGCSTTNGNVAYVSISSTGVMSKPATCPSGGYQGGDWCVDNVHTISGGIAATSPVVFGGRIYLVGGLNGTNNTNTINDTAVNTDGSIAGWATAISMTGIGATSVSYLFAYARANPSSAGTNPGNLYIFGGCSTSSAAGCTAYSQGVYKCNIQTSGAVAGCTTTSQLQIGIIPGDTQPGLGLMSGTVYAGYIYLIGGVSPNQTDLKTVRYAKFDNNNNVVAASGTTWTESPIQTQVGRRRGAAFGYNGYIYVTGGYDGTGGGGVLADIEFAKINVSDGSLVDQSGGLNEFNESSVTIGQRWGLSVPVSNSYAYVIGGCTTGAAPSSCTARTDTIQTFQLYNNDSGAPAAYSTSANTYGTSPNRIGASSTILNGYLYVAGGCTSTTDCTTAIGDVSYTAIDSSGNLGSWSSGNALPGSNLRAWGKLLTAGGALYYLGGQNSAGTAQSTIYYTTSITSGNPTWSATATTKAIGDTGSGGQARTQFGAAVWNNRLYVVGGINGSGSTTTTVFVSPQLNSGGDITSNWVSSTAFNVARSGLTAITYANNLYIVGGFDGTNYLSDVQYAQISTSDGSIGSWSYTTSMPNAVSQGDGFAVNGYMYLIGGRSASTSCSPNTLVAPISANTTIASGNDPTGVGQWFQTNVVYTGNRYGNTAVYSNGKAYVLGGGCGATLTYASPVTQQTALLTQPQIAQYSIMLDTSSDVFPNQWLLNGLDNSIGAQWQLRYRSMTNTTTSCTSPAMTTWGQDTNFGNVTLGLPGVYTPKDGSGANTNCARFFYFFVSVDSSEAYGYPDDVTRGPTITDLTLQFTADPSKRLMHGRTFTGGLQQPDDTPYYTH